MNTSIQAATPEDIPELLSFIREIAEYEKLLHEVVATEEGLRSALFGPRPCVEVVFLVEDGKKAAFALFFHNFSTFVGKPGLYLEDLYVRPEYRRKGYGKRLLGHLAKLAIERGCGRMEWAVLDWNKPALDFYELIGAVPMSGWTLQRLTGKNLQSLGSS
jgi:GNAT superfamily N-acetyltransferase